MCIIILILRIGVKSTFLSVYCVGALFHRYQSQTQRLKTNKTILHKVTILWNPPDFGMSKQILINSVIWKQNKENIRNILISEKMLIKRLIVFWGPIWNRNSILVPIRIYSKFSQKIILANRTYPFCKMW